jgi:ABC-type transport system involved in Fe-S cluster assembly fused permease/ATPase subunit
MSMNKGVRRRFRMIAAGTAVLVTTPNRLSTVAIAGRVLALRSGRVSEDGSPAGPPAPA